MVEVTTLKSGVQFALRDSLEVVDIAVIIVSWNVKELLLKNLESLKESTGDCLSRIIVIDNASTDGTCDAICDSSEVTMISNVENVGFARAVNQGIAKANARHILLLNPDMSVSSDALSKTVEYLDTHSDVGVLGAKLLNADGSVLHSVRRLPDVWSQLAILLKIPHLIPSVISRYLYSDFDYKQEQDVPSVRGSYFAISNVALEKIGGLDERYFIWFEEVDYCAQTLKSGLHVRYVPTIIAQDFVGKSFAQRKRFWKQRQFTKSMTQYFWKWHAGWQAIAISCIRLIPVSVAWIADRVIR